MLSTQVSRWTQYEVGRARHGGNFQSAHSVLGRIMKEVLRAHIEDSGFLGVILYAAGTT